MAYSYVRYTGNGAQTNYTFSFPYISQDHIKVRLNDVLTTSFTFLNTSTIQLNSAPANGVIVEIRRETPRDQVLVNYTNGSIFGEADLDLGETISLYLAQETQDSTDDCIRKNYQGNFDAQSGRIINADPAVDLTDLTTLSQVRTEISSAISEITQDAIYSTENFTATQGQTVFNLVNAYTPGNGSLAVFHNGSKLTVGQDYTETSGTSFTLTLGATAGDIISATTAKFVNPAMLPSQSVEFVPAGAGAVPTNVQAKLREFVSVKDFGAVGDGVTDDIAAVQAAKTVADANRNAIVSMANGRFNTTGTIWGNNISPLAIYSDKPSVLGLFEGTSANPDNVTNDPVLWVQKWTKFDNGTDRYAHNIGAIFGEVNVKGHGSSGATNVDGTWMAGTFNSVLWGTNYGTAVSQDWDAYGNVIGLAGFAESKGYPGDGNIICGVWAYAASPTMDATTFANLPGSNFATVGLEVNLDMNHPDPGYRTVLAGNGSVAGQLFNNYRLTGAGVKDWTFGMVFNGTPNDGNFASVDVANWSGYRVGILVDKIKNAGILMGQYFASGSYGIRFPASMAGMTERPAAGIYMGDTQLNWGAYAGASFNDGDMWRNGQILYYRKSGVSTEVITTSGVGTSGSYVGDRKITVNIGGTTYYLIASTTP